MGEGAPSLGSTGHENNRALARNTWQNIVGHFILCGVQPLAVYNGSAPPSAIHNHTEMHNKIVRKSRENCDPLKASTESPSA